MVAGAYLSMMPVAAMGLGLCMPVTAMGFRHLYIRLTEDPEEKKKRTLNRTLRRSYMNRGRTSPCNFGLRRVTAALHDQTKTKTKTKGRRSWLRARVSARAHAYL